MLNRVPIKMAAPLLFGIPVLAIGTWLSVMWNQQSQRAITELANQHIQQIHESTATKIADVLSTPVQVSQLNEHLVRSGTLDPSDLEGWRPIFVRESKAFDRLSSIVWGSADGRSAWVSRYADGTIYWAVKDDASKATMSEWRLGDSGSILETTKNTFEFKLSSRPWFQAPLEAREATWSEPFVWVGGADSQGTTLGISYGIPLFGADQEFLGIVDADYSLNDLSSYLQSLTLGTTGIAVLASSDGRLLATSNGTSVVTADGERVDARESPDLLIAAAATFIGNADAMLDRHAEKVVDGKTHYLRASEVGQEVGLNWTLATIIPEEDFLGDIRAGFRRSWLTSLVAVAATISLGILAAHWLVSPLNSLVTGVRRIGQGDLETRVHTRHSPEYALLATEINRMAAGLQDRMRMQRSLSLAMEVQRNLLPAEAPAIRGLDVAGHSTYCDETGGDYYDFLDVSHADEDRVVIVIGDVMGHGVAAALLMATARGILRSRCAVPGSLSDFLNHLNEMLVVDTQGERFMTMLLATVSASRKELRWASAGHGPPMIYDPAADYFREIDGGGLPLGLMEEERYEEYLLPEMKQGAIILALTDGVAETMNEAGELFGNDRLLQLVRDHAQSTADEISEAIRDSLAKYRGPAAQEDDVTFVVAKIV